MVMNLQVKYVKMSCLRVIELDCGTLISKEKVAD